MLGEWAYLLPHSLWLVSLFCTIEKPAEPLPVDC